MSDSSQPDFGLIRRRRARIFAGFVALVVLSCASLFLSEIVFLVGFVALLVTCATLVTLWAYSQCPRCGRVLFGSGNLWRTRCAGCGQPLYDPGGDRLGS